jgi:hypothetical protein
MGMGGMGEMGGMGGMGGMGMGGMGMGGMEMGPGSTMNTNNIDLPYLKNQLLNELKQYNEKTDSDLIISTIKNSEYIKQLRKSLHNPTVFQKAGQTYLEALGDWALRPAEVWKTKFKQALNTSTLDDIFNKMLDKQKSSIDAGNDITSRELTNLFGINYNAQNCGAPTTSTGGTGGTSGTGGSSSSGSSRLKNLFSSKPKTPGEPTGAAPPGATTPHAAKVKLTAAEVLAKHEEDTKNHLAAVEEKAKLKAVEIQTRAERTAAGTLTAKDRALNLKDEAALAASKAAAAASAKAASFKKSVAQTGLNVLASLRGGPRAVPASTGMEMPSVAAGGGQEGGGRRRHNRTRYISDIKNNRRRLYEREKEIIQSIRNFEKGNIKSHHNKTRKFGKMLRRR